MNRALLWVLVGFACLFIAYWTTRRYIGAKYQMAIYGVIGTLAVMLLIALLTIHL
jgi:hypothetical protein